MQCTPYRLNKSILTSKYRQLPHAIKYLLGLSKSGLFDVFWFHFFILTGMEVFWFIIVTGMEFP